VEDSIITLQDVSYDYHGDGANSIDTVNLSIATGEFILIAGKSGSGKTTVAKCINGLIPYFHEGILEGNILVQKKNTKEMELHEIGELVGSVFQDPRSQFFTTNTTDEVAFGCQNRGLSREYIFKRIDATFSELNIHELADRSIFKISNGEKQKIAIASCFAMSPDVYLFDEPSANLDIVSTVHLAELLAALKKYGKTIIIIEHRLYYLKKLIDRVVYMQDGKIAAVWTKDKIDGFTADELVNKGLRAFDLRKAHYRAIPLQKQNKIRFVVNGLCFDYPKQAKAKGAGLLRNVSFSASGGEIIGIVGRNGAGKTTLAKLCCGLLKEQRGAVSLDGENEGGKLNSGKRRGKIYFVMQDSDYQLFSDSVIKELTLGFSGKRSVGKTDVENRCVEVLASLGLLPLKDAHPAALSRGQKQRLTIGTAIMSGAKVIFFDEPTSGLDGDAMKQVAQRLSALAMSGCAVFVVTHDYELLLESASRILHLSNGTIADDFLLNSETEGRLISILFNVNDVNGSNRVGFYEKN
jgi:energy-coupling factor transport system ATP-binding protein